MVRQGNSGSARCATSQAAVKVQPKPAAKAKPAARGAAKRPANAPAVRESGPAAKADRDEWESF